MQRVRETDLVAAFRSLGEQTAAGIGVIVLLCGERRLETQFGAERSAPWSG
jgi:hypothetical protein